MRLLVDCGNSRLKWVLTAPAAWAPQALAHRGQEPAALLARAWGALAAPDEVWVCCVAGAELRAALADWSQRRWGRAPRFLEAQARTLDLVNGYRDPAQLGPDRWAALLGARALGPGPACVVDCGTAVTIDALSADGEFLGGVIFPGLALLREGLARGTAALAAAPGDAASCQARTSADAIAAGTLHGLAGAIGRCADEHARVLGAAMRLVITGGDAPELLARLARPAMHVPDLVLRGLQRVAGA